MGMQSYETRGYGIEFDRRGGRNTTGDKIRAMLELAPELKEDVNSWLKDCDIDPETATVEDYEDFEQDYGNGIPALIAFAMNEYYGHLIVDASSDENGILYLYLPYELPWDHDEFVSGLTEESFSDMLRKFYNMLYEDEAEIGRVYIHDFG